MKSFRKIILENGVQGYETTRRILARLPDVPVEEIPDISALRRPAADPALWLAESKTTLLLALQKGPFWRPCPGTRDYVCCGYQTLQVTVNCPFDCAYCILQSYINLPVTTIFVNIEDLLAELDQKLAEDPEKIRRLGTGEFGDSLALDGIMGLNERLIPFFARHPRAVLEIKTKWHDLAPLLPLGPNRQVIFAWSLNPPAIVRNAERGSASLGARLKAARQAQDAGFRLAFHFDPIIYFPGWEEAYRDTVARLAAAVSPEAVVWISLGALRFLPALREITMTRYPSCRFAAAEMVLAPDGKLRYFKTLRLELYGRLREWLEQALPGVEIYLCMESPRIWQGVFGASPTEAELGSRLDKRVVAAARG
ncbi:MAG: radical SAM protein [Deltaproteobacteria bacterium]|nr:radical SAM protein [Deltaproteobacteria bacterium]